jgi:FMN phosphatase YigB (HAD superfamily)
MQVRPDEAVMVGDSLPHGVRGAMEVGMHGVLLARGGRPPVAENGVPVIASLRELPALLA